MLLALAVCQCRGQCSSVCTSSTASYLKLIRETKANPLKRGHLSFSMTWRKQPWKKARTKLPCKKIFHEKRMCQK